MLIATVNTLRDPRIVRYLGVVSGEAILGANVCRDLLAGIRDIVGGRSASECPVGLDGSWLSPTNWSAEMSERRYTRALGTGHWALEDIVRNLPFDKPGRFWRGNVHTHSTRSDGKLTPEEVIRRYRAQRYDFIALTDHFLERYGYPIVDTREWRDERFTTLSGAELHAPALAHGDLWHIVAVGLPFDFAPNRNGEGGPALAARAADAGAFVGIAHPGWYSLTLVDALTIEAAHAVEIYNHTAYYDNDRADGWYISDQFGILGRRHFAYAADDAHFSTRPDYFGAWVQVKAKSLDPDALLAALKAGQFYSSQGPEIHDVAFDGNQLRVANSPARAIFLGGSGSKSRRVIAEPGAAVTEATFPLDLFAGGFCRVTVVDADGRRAWSNPIWLE